MAAAALAGLAAFAPTARAQELVGFSKVFSPDTILVGQTSTLTFTITNNDEAGKSSLAFTDTLPSGVVVATPNGAVDGCGGSLTATSGTDTIIYTGGSIAGPGGSCDVSVVVTSSTAGTYDNLSGNLSSDFGTHGTAADTLLVEAPGTIVIVKDAVPDDGQDFSFTDNIEEPNAFALDDDADGALPNTRTFLSVAPGSYQVAEAEPMGWFFDDTSSCEGGNSGFDGPTAFIELESGGTVTCTFVNQKLSDVGFSKSFDPSTIGPGSTSTLTFVIDNSASPTLVTDLAFTDVLPAGVTLADPANVSTTCLLGAGGSISAPDGGGTIALGGGQLGGGESCTISVDVTSATVGTHTNVSGDLTSSSGNSGAAAAALDVVTTFPGFSKSFAPSTVTLGGRSTLTFTIDNSANDSAITNLDFTDNLPAGMEIADPTNAATTCGTALIPPTLVAAAGTDIILFDHTGTVAFPTVAGGAICTVTVDVIATGDGELDNVSGNLKWVDPSFVERFIGKASATLTVPATDLAIRKSFTDDPVPPGGNVELEFTIDNFDRDFPATGVAFSDDLTTLVPSLPGLTFDSVLSNDCGGSVSGAGTTTVTFTGGTLAAQDFCTIRVSLTVPAGAVLGAYANTTSAVTGTVDGVMVTGNMASEVLYVEPVPVLTKLFVGDPVNAGGTVTLRFTVANTSTTSGATDIAFDDELTDGSSGFPPDPTSGFLPFPVSVTLPPVPDPPCGAGSSLALVSAGTDRQALRLTGGSLAAAPGAGSTCTFEVTVTIPATFAPGTYVNTTEEITATVDTCGDGCLDTVTGRPASDDLTVIAAPQLTKAFTDDPAPPGGTVTLEFTLSHSPSASGDATGISFTDDLATVLAGLTANLPPTPDPPCGAGSTLTGSAGDTLLTLLGGTLTPGDSCTFSVTLDVPAGAAAGSYTNTTSGVGATVDGLAVTSPAASDDLDVQGLVFTKEFLGNDVDNPAIPGETLTLRFTIANDHPTDDATLGVFTDDLAAVLPGTPDLTTSLPPPVDTCGGTPGLAGSSFFSYTGGSVMSGQSCTIELTVTVPAGAPDGTYLNLTSSLSATQGDVAVAVGPAIDELLVSSNVLQLTKEFTDDPVAPGGAVNLRFTLTNLDAVNPVSGIAFTDDLDADPALAGIAITNTLPFSACGGTVAGIPDATDLDFSGGSLGPGGQCSFDVSVSIADTVAAGVYTNTTSDVSGTLGGLAVSGDAASDDLQVVDLLLFSKSFDGPTTAGGTAVLTFTITNPTASTATGISFSDNLDDVLSGLVASDVTLDVPPCGEGSSLSGEGTGFLAFTGGQLPPSGGTCSFGVELTLPAMAAAGIYPNVTSELFQNGLPVADPATADLVVLAPAIDVEKATNGVDADAAPGPSLFEGAPVSWTYVVTNTGDVDLVGVAVSDDQSVTVTCPKTTLAVDDSMTCTASGVAVPGQYENTGTATGTSSPGGFEVEDSDLSHYFGIAFGTIVIQKQTDPAGGTGFTFSDDIEEPGSFSLDDGQSQIFTEVLAGSYTVAETVPAGWSLTDVSCDDPGGEARRAGPGAILGLVPLGTRGVETGVTIDLGPGETVTCTFTNTAQGIEISKTPEFPQVFAGSAATFTIGLRNSGLTELTNLAVSDPLTPDCGRAPGELPALAAGGETSYTCATAPLFAGLTNVATVTADVAQGPPVSAVATAVVEVLDPVIEITKTPAEQQILAGETATFTITVRNLGDDGLTDLVVVDLETPDCERGGSEGAPDLPDLPAGQSVFYECTTEPLGADLTNVATVSAVARSGLAVSASASALVTVIPPIEITKSPSEQQILPGETATFTITLANPGAVPKTDVVVSDPLTSACDLALPGLAAGATFSYSCTTDPLFADLTNRATVTAASPAGTVEATSTALVRVVEPPIAIAKLLIAQVVNPGDAAPFTITVSNPGTLTLTGVSVADPATTDCAMSLPDIAPGGEESYGCTSDPVFADFTNVATVTATAGVTVVSASASAEVNVREPIVITKSPAEQAVSFGEAATFTLTVRNEGTDVKTGVAVSDPLTPDCDRAVGVLGDLAPNGGTTTYTCTTGALTADLLNEATVTATGDEGPVTDSATALVVVLTDLEITKTPELQQLEAGEPATFTLEVTNGGDQVVTGVVVTDPETPACDADLGDLDPGETVSYSCATEPLFADLTNVATVSGEVAEGEVRATATAVVEVVRPLTITKEPPEQEIQAGETAGFTITVANPSRVTRTGVVVADPLTPSCARAAGVLVDLAPGASVSYDCTSDPLFASLVNVATATAEGPSGTVSAFDAALVSVLAPEIGISKTPDVQLVSPGGSATFTITLTNPGPGALTGLAVSDPLTPDCGRAAGVLPDLPAGVSTSYDCVTGPLTEDFVNVATVTATSEIAVAVSASASAEVIVVDPIDIVKGPLEQSVPVGGVAAFTITLINESDVLKTGVAVSDPQSPDCDRAAGTLPDLLPGGGTFTYGCTSGPVLADFVNVATVAADSAEGPVTASASALVQAVALAVPTVVEVSTADGPLAVCDTVRTPIRRIEVTIGGSEPPFPGADDPASYLLVGSGGDGDFATVACGAAAGDDIPVEIVSVSLTASDPAAVTAGLGLGVSLAPGLYRLLVCDTITDELGNALDGDGDGNPGVDFVLRFFRADPFNRFENGHFDDCRPVTLAPWIVVESPPNDVQPGTLGADDSESSPLSASAAAAHASPEPSAVAQCVPVEGGRPYELRNRVRFDPLMAAIARFEATCEFFAAADCTGASLGSVSVATILEDEGGAWLFLESEVAAAAGAASAVCDFAVESVRGDDFDAFLDGLFLGSEGLIFTDGFESGDVSAWSSSVP